MIDAFEQSAQRRSTNAFEHTAKEGNTNFLIVLDYNLSTQSIYGLMLIYGLIDECMD